MYSLHPANTGQNICHKIYLYGFYKAGKVKSMVPRRILLKREAEGRTSCLSPQRMDVFQTYDPDSGGLSPSPVDSGLGAFFFL